MSLPSMVYPERTRKNVQTAFGAYHHSEAASDGEIFDMANVTCADYPAIGAREARYLVQTLDGAPNGYYVHDGVFVVSGKTLYVDGEKIATLKNSRKTFATLGMFTVILPDKVYYNRLTGDYGKIEASVVGACYLQNGTYAGEEAAANTLCMPGVDFSGLFKVGDAVEISGCRVHPSNNKTPIIREIDGENLRFYENTFEIEEGSDSCDYETSVTVARNMPDLDFICENENRLWGCKGNTVYASKLGDLFNWNVFDGLSTDSYAADVGSSGDFTGCFSYLGYPCFFKERHIYKVYGDKPSNFQLTGSATLGLAEGSDRSLAVAGEMLYYLSPVGICAYSGGIPQCISESFGNVRYKDAVGGSDGLRYYVCMKDEKGCYSLFVYDTRYRLWEKQDIGRKILAFGNEGGLSFLDNGGEIWLDARADDVPADATKENEAEIESFIEFADFICASPDKKGISKIQLRLEVGAGARLLVYISYDSDGEWRTVASLTADKKRSVYLPIVPRRCDHFKIRLQGAGAWKLFSLSEEYYAGSAL